MTRREAAQRAALTDAIAFLTLRCQCGSGDLTAVAPGADDAPDRAWCSTCWVEAQAAVRTA